MLSHRLLRHALVWLVALLTACGAGQAPEETAPQNDAEALAKADQALILRLAASNGPFVVYADPYGDGTPNPAEGIRGYAGTAIADDVSYVAIRVSNLPPNRVFGAHVHRLACADNKGGTHYQNVISPTTPTDPAYANAENEVWLDFTTNAFGAALSTERAGFAIRHDDANSIVIHTSATGAGGVAGAKLACIDLDF